MEANCERGRVRAVNIVDCEPTKESIGDALAKAVSPEFRESLRHMISPYEKKNTALNIKELIKKADLKNLLKKKFWDIS